MISFQDVRFAYSRSGFALEVPSLKLEQGECVALTGASGSGKTTLLHLAAGLLSAERGAIVSAGVNLRGLTTRARSTFRIQHVGLVFQSFELLPHLDALGNILLPLRLSSRLRLTRQSRADACAVAQSLGIEGTLSRKPEQLSQGEQQRIAIARALVAGPGVVLGDEPTGNLDRATKHRVVDLLLEVCSRRKATVLMATHDVELLDRFDRTISILELTKSGTSG